MTFSSKQRQFFREANHRYNIKSGATRSGKTYMDYFLIPKRIRAAAGKEGHVVLLGNTRGTLQRNIIEPLQQIWTAKLVSDIKSDNTAKLFGVKAHCLGADKVSSVDVIRGSSFAYCYGDEVVSWHPDVFQMVKSRLDKPYSCFDGTCNPDNPKHWFHEFLVSSGSDIYLQEYTLDDNPYLDRSVSDAIKADYEGTVYYDRYVLGKWVAAEGAVYRAFADNPDRFVVDAVDKEDILFCTGGVDFGGGTSAHSFQCTGFLRDGKGIVTLHEYYEKGALDPEQLGIAFCGFISECKSRGYNIVDVYADSAEQTLINGLRVSAARNRLGVEIHNARKYPINDRVRFYTAMMARGKYKVLSGCKHTVEAFSGALWNNKRITEDVRLDDGTSNIDTLDAQEYSTEPYMKRLLEAYA